MSPKTVRWIIVITAIISIVGVAVFTILFEFTGPSEEQEWTLMNTIFCEFLALFLFSLAAWEIVDDKTRKIFPNSVLVSGTTGKIDRVVTKKLMVWKRTFTRSGLANIVLGTQTAFINMEVSPITKNPKVIMLRYKVEVKGLFDDSTKLQLFLDNMWASGIKLWDDFRRHILSVVKFQLYELNEKNSKELAVFYNPEDKKQQANFQTCIADLINPALRKVGLVVESASFQLG